MSTAHAGTLDRDKLFTARLHAARARPYLATALFALHVVESRWVPTMAVDPHWRCYVSPRFVDRTPVEELAGVWVHEVSHLLRDHHGRSERVAREQGLTGPGERLRMNIAADCEINDDIFGDGLARPEGAVEPGDLQLPAGQLMEDYLRQFRLGPRIQHLAWLDCGSGADGMQRRWDLGPDGAHALSPQERDAVRFRVAEGITGRPGDVPQGWRRWAERAFHPPQPWREILGAAVRSAVSAPGVGRTTPTGGRRGAPPAHPAWSCPRCAAGHHGYASSSTPPARSATSNSAAPCWRSPRSPGPWVVAATWSVSCPVTRHPRSYAQCAEPRTSP